MTISEAKGNAASSDWDIWPSAYDPMDYNDYVLTMEKGALLHVNDSENGLLEPATQSYLPVESFPSPQQQEIESSEKALFEDNQSAQAILPLQKLLAGEIRDPATIRSGDHYDIGPHRTRPYLEYLLDLAYELTGDKANAVHSYWQLWHDYPENPYALVVRHKLIPLIP